jgi:hypothetical protein
MEATKYCGATYAFAAVGLDLPDDSSACPPVGQDRASSLNSLPFRYSQPALIGEKNINSAPESNKSYFITLLHNLSQFLPGNDAASDEAGNESKCEFALTSDGTDNLLVLDRSTVVEGKSKTSRTVLKLDHFSRNWSPVDVDIENGQENHQLGS